MQQVSPVPLHRSEVLSTLRIELPVIREKYGIIRIGLFGSYARDEAGPMSDIDLLVSFEEGKNDFVHLCNPFFYLEITFGKNVELISEHSLDQRIRPDVEREVIWI